MEVRQVDSTEHARHAQKVRLTIIPERRVPVPKRQPNPFRHLIRRAIFLDDGPGEVSRVQRLDFPQKAIVEHPTPSLDTGGNRMCKLYYVYPKGVRDKELVICCEKSIAEKYADAMGGDLVEREFETPGVKLHA